MRRAGDQDAHRVASSPSITDPAVLRGVMTKKNSFLVHSVLRFDELWKGDVRGDSGAAAGAPCPREVSQMCWQRDPASRGCRQHLARAAVAFPSQVPVSLGDRGATISQLCTPTALQTPRCLFAGALWVPPRHLPGPKLAPGARQLPAMTSPCSWLPPAHDGVGREDFRAPF